MPALDHIETFLEVARQHSFARAAHNLGITGPAASKQVMALEADLGVKLLHRTTRLVTLTDEGALYFDRATLALDELREAAAQLQDMKLTPKGALRITAPASFGHAYLLPALTGFAQKYPDIRMDVSMDDRMVDVVAEGYDMAIRIGVPQDSTLITRHLGDSPLSLVASPAYIKARGTPKTAADLKDHAFIGYANAGGALEWKYKDPAGKTATFKGNCVFRANTAEMMLAAALAGIGIALLPHFSCAADIKAGRLVQILPRYQTVPKRTITALMPPTRYRTAKVKLLVDWLAKACKSLPCP